MRGGGFWGCVRREIKDRKGGGIVEYMRDMKRREGNIPVSTCISLMSSSLSSSSTTSTPSASCISSALFCFLASRSFSLCPNLAAAGTLIIGTVTGFFCCCCDTGRDGDCAAALGVKGSFGGEGGVLEDESTGSYFISSAEMHFSGSKSIEREGFMAS